MNYQGFLIGFWSRLFNFIKIELINYLAKSKGVSIGKNTEIPFSLAKNSNYNLTIGDNCGIQTDLLDLRCPLIIGNNVIIGKDVEILTCSHNINSSSTVPL